MTPNPVTLSAFVPDPEVHRIRQEMQILEAQLAPLLARQVELDGLYHAAISAADPQTVYSPEYIAASASAFDAASLLIQ